MNGGPQQATSRSGILLHIHGELDQLLNIGPDFGFGSACELNAFVEKWRIQSEVYLDVSLLLEDSVVKLLAMNQELDLRRLLHPIFRVRKYP